MLTYDDLWPHFCLLIYPQDSWKEKDIDQISKNIKELILYLTGHADCQVCNSCPICHSYNELFDPNEPGSYHENDCTICKVVKENYEKRLGRKHGIILFAHSIIPNEAIELMVEKLLDQSKVKKICLLQVELPSLKEKRHKRKYKKQSLTQQSVRKTDFLKRILFNQLDRLTIYEITKDIYF